MQPSRRRHAVVVSCRIRCVLEGVVERVEVAAHRNGGAGRVGLAVVAIFNQADWQLLFIEFWARAVRDPNLREEFARQRRAARELIARFIEQQAARPGVDLPAPSAQLAIAVLALSNGIAIEHLADPETVDRSVFGATLGLLLGGLGTDARSTGR